jgi:superfamily II DNA helicase RecQ
MEDDIKRILQDKQFHRASTAQIRAEGNNTKCVGKKKFNRMAVLPTGFGKSMCYVLPPLILDKVSSYIVYANHLP